ncbi:MAG TPA: DinB family protein [Candidatus Eisenbacteria bacterium]|nr:DinB family protein [Candidatus Eisenbacteria bacterium]
MSSSGKGREREIERLADEHRRALRGPSWHGPSVLQVLDGVRAETASRRAVPGAHTIWEIVRHIEVWDRVVIRRIEGEIFDPTPEQDWPPVLESDEASWTRDVAAMVATHEELNAAIRGLTPDALDVRAAENRPELSRLVYGAAHHELYHAGQIAILRKD